MTRRLMFVHAHPDDESSKGAATAARYLDEGVEVTLVTCTAGEAGDVLNSSAPDVPRERMAEVRAGELADAVAAIGFTRTYQLGFVDSGYHEDPADVSEGAFSRQPLDVPAAALAAIIRSERPHVVVTYPEDGGYPHPDHIMNYLVTMRAMELAEAPDADLDGRVATEQDPWRIPKVYATGTFPIERLEALRDAMLAVDPDSSYVKRAEERLARRGGLVPDTRVECGDWFYRRDAALRAHVTQVDPSGSWFEVPRDLERAHYPYEAYLVLRSDVIVPPDETDLFAGLDAAT
ncbi:MAG: PIG-L family deacetylase [Nitriliruptoraceae bacterium]